MKLYLTIYIFLDISEKPGNVVVADHDNCSAEIKWDPPSSDGGAPIEKYIIQKKAKDSPNWENATEVPGGLTSGKVTDLPEGSEFQFRVIAVNKAGPSSPSDPTKMTMIRHKSRKYFY